MASSSSQNKKNQPKSSFSSNIKQTQQKQQKQQLQEFKVINQSEFPFLQQMPNVKLVHENSLKQKDWVKLLASSENVLNAWFKLYTPSYLLYEVNQQKKTIKIYENHKILKSKNYLRWGKQNFTLTFDKWRHFTQKSQVSIFKNFINGSFGCSISHLKQKFDQTSEDMKILQIHYVSTNLMWNKWLSSSVHQNSKTMTYGFSKAFSTYNTANIRLFISNRQNFRNQPQKIVLGQSPVLKSSDILGHQMNFYTAYGLKLKFGSGYNFFNKSYYNKIGFRYKKYFQFQNISLQFRTRGGTIFGNKTIQLNDLLNRNKTRFMPDLSTRFLNSRIDIFVNKYHETLKSLGIYPYMYLEGWISRNTNTNVGAIANAGNKYELDYGIGLKIRRFYMDWSLLRVGKNIDQFGGPSIKFNF